MDISQINHRQTREITEISKKKSITLDQLVKQIVVDHNENNALENPKRLIYAITGPPGAGKTFISLKLEKLLNQQCSSASLKYPTVKTISVDGWHYSRKHLSQMDDPELAFQRRGAHWTFDGEKYIQFLHDLEIFDSKIRTSDSEDIQKIFAPSFDHSEKDPVENSISIPCLPESQILIIEGLWACLSIKPWVNARKWYKRCYLIDIDMKSCFARVVDRHVKTGVTKDVETAKERWFENDKPNGIFCIENCFATQGLIL